MRRYLWWGVGILIGVIVLGAVFGPEHDDFSGFGEGVALIPLQGPIYSAEETTRWIEKARKSERVQAVVLRVDSPGGAVGASQEIYHALKRLREDKPLVASFGNVAASGGYYAGMAAQHIFALPGTITASIGVRMSTLDASGILDFLMVKPGVLKSGALKDAGAPHRAMTDEERAYFEALLANMHQQFKGHVAESRSLDAAAVEQAADGRVVTGEEALELGLVDALGDLYDAIAYAGKEAGLEEDPEILRIPEPDAWDNIFGAAGARLTQWLRAPRLGYFAW